MRQQWDILRETQWNTLVVMDACRYDKLHRVAPELAQEQVLAGANVTYRWINRFANQFRGEDILFFTANPVCDRELQNHLRKGLLHWEIVPLYRTHWGTWGDCDAPTVHPRDVVRAVMDYTTLYGQPHRMVVWFMQPHAPYIGTNAIPYQTWGGGMDDELTKQVKKMSVLKRAFLAGEVTARQVELAYEGNVDVVVKEVRALLPELRGRTIVTADHGEMLGEHGEIEHSAPPIYPELMTVPLSVHVGLEYEPAPIKRAPAWPDPDPLLLKKLHALGYA